MLAMLKPRWVAYVCDAPGCLARCAVPFDQGDTLRPRADALGWDTENSLCPKHAHPMEDFEMRSTKPFQTHDGWFFERRSDGAVRIFVQQEGGDVTVEHVLPDQEWQAVLNSLTRAAQAEEAAEKAEKETKEIVGEPEPEGELDLDESPEEGEAF